MTTGPQVPPLSPSSFHKPSAAQFLLTLSCSPGLRSKATASRKPSSVPQPGWKSALCILSQWTAELFLPCLIIRMDMFRCSWVSQKEKPTYETLVPRLLLRFFLLMHQEGVLRRTLTTGILQACDSSQPETSSCSRHCFRLHHLGSQPSK